MSGLGLVLRYVDGLLLSSADVYSCPWLYQRIAYVEMDPCNSEILGEKNQEETSDSHWFKLQKAGSTGCSGVVQTRWYQRDSMFYK
jgi:hypothetical protein